MAKKSSKKPPTAQQQPTEVAFEFIKGTHFRVLSIDGVFGGLSPQGRNIHMALFSERRPLPRKVVHHLSSVGALGDEITAKRESREGFVREVEVDVVMDLPTAIATRKWLTDRISEMATICKVTVDLENGEIKPKEEK